MARVQERDFSKRLLFEKLTTTAWKLKTLLFPLSQLVHLDSTPSLSFRRCMWSPACSQMFTLPQPSIIIIIINKAPASFRS